MPDLNEAHRDGMLPANLTEGGEPMTGAAPAETPPKLVGIGDVLTEALVQIQRRKDGKARPAPVPWPELGKALGGGLWPGVHILVGNTGTAKTQMALQMALHAAREGSPVLYVGLEMDELQVGARLLALEAGKVWAELYLGQCEPSELEPTRETLSKLPLKVSVQDPYSWSIDYLAAMGGELIGGYDGPTAPLVVLDFLQVIGTGEKVERGRQSELRERIGKAAYEARKLQRKGVATLLVSSTARNNYPILSGADKQVKLGETHPSALIGMGKESGEIEYSADSVLVLCRKDEQRYIAVAKARAYLDGDHPPGWVKLDCPEGKWTDDVTTEKRATYDGMDLG